MQLTRQHIEAKLLRRNALSILSAADNPNSITSGLIQCRQAFASNVSPFIPPTFDSHPSFLDTLLTHHSHLNFFTAPPQSTIDTDSCDATITTTIISPPQVEGYEVLAWNAWFECIEIVCDWIIRETNTTILPHFISSISSIISILFSSCFPTSPAALFTDESLVAKVQEKLIRCLTKMGNAARSEANSFGTMSVNLDKAIELPTPQQLQQESLPQQPPLSPSLFFWDALTPLFTPDGGAIYEWMNTWIEESIENEEQVEGMDQDEIQERDANRHIELAILHFLHDLVFTPAASPSSSTPSSLSFCPWLLDHSFISQWLQQSYLSVKTRLQRLSRKQEEKDRAMYEKLIVMHVDILCAAARLPTVIYVPSSDAIAATTTTPPPTPIRFSLLHIHSTLYRLGIMKWLCDLIGLELECEIELKLAVVEKMRKEVSKNESTEVENQNHENLAEQSHELLLSSSRSTAHNELTTAMHSNRDTIPSSKRSSKDSKRSKEDGSEADEEDDSEDFSEINFEDSYDDQSPPHHEQQPEDEPPTFKLAIASNSKQHMNERFALGMDGQPLHPENEEGQVEEEEQDEEKQQQEVEEVDQEHAIQQDLLQEQEQIQQENQATSEPTNDVLEQSQTAVSTSDLGPNGWGDDSLDVTPRHTANANIVSSIGGAGFKLALGGTKVEEQQQQQQVDAPGPPNSVPTFSPILSTPHASSPPRYSSLRLQSPLYTSPSIHASLIDLILHLCLDPSSEGRCLNERYCTRYPLVETEDRKRRKERMMRFNQDDTIASDTSLDVPLDAQNEASKHSQDQSAAETQPFGRNVLFLLQHHVNACENQYLVEELEKRHRQESPFSPSPSSQHTVSLHRLKKLLLTSLFSPGSFINRTQIGRGRFANVYGAEYRSDDATKVANNSKSTAMISGQRYALKQVDQPASMYDQVLLVDLFIEVSALECVALDKSENLTTEQSHVISLLDYGVGGGAYWLVLPLAQSSLKQYLIQQAENSSSLPPQSSADRLLASMSLYSQALDACALLQAANIVHCDIKADNFLVFHGKQHADSSSPVRIALADFGEAFFVASDPTSSSQSDTDTFASIGSRIPRGTENIQSPEMLTLMRALDRTHTQYDRRRKHEIDLAADAWSVGALFYEICMHPYHALVNEDEDAVAASESSTLHGSAGLLFEEISSLPLFIQVTHASLPLLSDAKSRSLKSHQALGPLLLPLCTDFLTFVMQRDRLQRPTIQQIRGRFESLRNEVKNLSQVNNS